MNVRMDMGRNSLLPPPQHCEYQLVLKFPVQLPGAVLRGQRLRLVIGENGQGAEHGLPAAGIADHGVPGAVIDLDALNAGRLFQICLQNVGLPAETWQAPPRESAGGRGIREEWYISYMYASKE